jgi:hypothetical protein
LVQVVNRQVFLVLNHSNEMYAFLIRIGKA